MERINDSYKLSTGKIIHPNNGIIGLSEVDGFKVYEGYDGSWSTEDTAYDQEDVDLTNTELKEIALYMSNLWKNMADEL